MKKYYFVVIFVGLVAIAPVSQVSESHAESKWVKPKMMDIVVAGINVGVDRNKDMIKLFGVGKAIVDVDGSGLCYTVESKDELLCAWDHGATGWVSSITIKGGKNIGKGYPLTKSGIKHFKTGQGIGLGASKQLVIKTYGKPSEVKMVDEGAGVIYEMFHYGLEPKDAGHEYYYYDALYYFKHGVLAKIIIMFSV